MKTDKYLFNHISLRFSSSLLRFVQNFGENQTTHFMTSNFLFENGIMWENIAERGRPQMTIWLMRIACWIRNVTNTHSEYVILTVFALLQRLNKRISVLHYTYVACMVKTTDIVTRIQILFPMLFFSCNIYTHITL